MTTAQIIYAFTYALGYTVLIGGAIFVINQMIKGE